MFIENDGIYWFAMVGDIDAESLRISKVVKDNKIEENCLDIDRHIKEKWFLDENRQIGFFAKKLAELNDMKQ